MILQDIAESLMVRVIKFNRFLKYARILETDVLFTKAVRKCLSLTIDLRWLSFYLDRRSQMSVSENRFMEVHILRCPSLKMELFSEVDA
jgi:hypothetical protein